MFGYAQSTILFSGKITDPSNNALAGATVSLLNTNYNTTTDANGAFNFQKIYGGTYVLQASAEGYATVQQTITISNEQTHFSIALQSSAIQLESVVVTAQKTEQLLQRLLLSVTALSARQIEEYRLWNVKEITAISPNLFSADPGDKRNVTSIRGITSTSYDQAVATYIDGVNQFGLDTYIPQLFDIERIEILRGPQGTLWGRNAMGGVINIITKQPTNRTDGLAEISIGNYGQKRLAAGVRAPIVLNKLYLGVAGLYDGADGFYTNTFNNTQYDKQHTLTSNYYLKYLASTKWALTANIKHSAHRNNGPFQLVNGVEEAFMNPYQLSQNAITQMQDNTLNASLSVNYAGTGFNFTSQTAYQSNYRIYTTPIDADFSPIDGISLINNYGKDWNKVKVYTQEFKVSSSPAKAAAFTWVAGTYLFHQTAPVKQATRFGEDAALVGSPDKNFSLINSSQSKNSGVAVYAQGTYAINKKVELTAGLRYDYEKKQQSILGEYQVDPDPMPVFPYRPDTSASVDYNAISPTASISFYATQNNHLYVSYHRGYRTGGLTGLGADPSQPPLFAYQPEYSNNYEIGVKNMGLQNRLRLNVSLFYSLINNAQVPTLVLPDAITITKNAGSLRSKGIEVETAFTPLKGLELAYNFGYTNAVYKS